MSAYDLLGETVTFSDPEDNYWQVQYEVWMRCSNLEKAFDKWYASRSLLRNPLDDVILDSEGKTGALMDQNFVTPFYFILSQFQMNYLTTVDFRKQCLNLDALREVLREISEIARNIPLNYDPKLAEQALQQASGYEEPQEGGRSFSFAELMEPGTPGSMYEVNVPPPPRVKPNNEATRYKHLFELGAVYMHHAVRNCFLASVRQFVDLVLAEQPRFFSQEFDYPASVKALEDAALQDPPEKKKLLKAFRLCPWNPDFYSLCFQAFPDDPDTQLSLVKVAKEFHLDLSEDVERALEAMYAARTSDNEADLKKLRTKIQDRMRLFNRKESRAFDALENNILGQICNGYESSDRLTCCQMELRVHKQDLSDKNKKLWMKRLQDRLNAISSAEDGQNFEVFLKECDVLVPGEVAAAIEYVKEECPKESRDLFLEAFRTFSQENVRLGRFYHPISGKDFTSRFVRSWGIFLAVAGFLLLFAVRGIWMLLPWGIIAGGILIHIYITMAGKLWKRMTLQGTVIHKVFTVDKKTFRQMCRAAKGKVGPGGIRLTRKGRYDDLK